MVERPKTMSKMIRSKIIKDLAISRLEEFRQYTLEMELKFTSDKKRLSDLFEDTIKGLPEEEIKDIIEFYAEDYDKTEVIYIGLYRNSILISLYSFLENSMNALCHHLYKRDKYPVKLEDLKGDGLVRAKEYLTKLSGLKLDSVNGEWSYIKSFNKVRNCIVHTEGNINKFRDTKILKNIISNTPGLSLRRGRHIEVDRNYIDFVIEKIESFLSELHDQLLDSKGS